MKFTIQYQILSKIEMKRNLLLVISIILLCSTTGIAQKTISESDYNHLVDYANCMYLKTFIEKKGFALEYMENTYKPKIKPVLENVTLENLNGILGYDKLKVLFSKNDVALALAKKINDKKSNFNNYLDDKTLIDSLGATKWKGVDLKQTARLIQNKILTKYQMNDDGNNEKVVTPNKEIKDTSIQFLRQVKELQIKLGRIEEQYNDSKVSFDKFRLLVVGTFGSLIIFFVFIFFYINQGRKTNKRNENKVRKYINDVFLNSRELKDELSKGKDYSNKKIEQLQSDFEDFKRLHDFEKIAGRLNDIDNLKEMIEQIQNRIYSLEHPKNPPRLPEQKSTIEEPDTTSNSDKIFLKEREGMILFKETTNENAYYEIFNINGNKAYYRFCGNEDRAIEYYDAVLKDVFDDEKTYSLKAKKIVVGKEGNVELLTDGKWEIKTLAKIKFIS